MYYIVNLYNNGSMSLYPDICALIFTHMILTYEMSNISELNTTEALELSQFD